MKAHDLRSGCCRLYENELSMRKIMCAGRNPLKPNAEDVNNTRSRRILRDAKRHAIACLLHGVLILLIKKDYQLRFSLIFNYFTTTLVSHLDTFSYVFFLYHLHLRQITDHKLTINM